MTVSVSVSAASTVAARALRVGGLIEHDIHRRPSEDLDGATVLRPRLAVELHEHIIADAEASADDLLQTLGTGSLQSDGGAHVGVGREAENLEFTVRRGRGRGGGDEIAGLALICAPDVTTACVSGEVKEDECIEGLRIELGRHPLKVPDGGVGAIGGLGHEEVDVHAQRQFVTGATVDGRPETDPRHGAAATAVAAGEALAVVVEGVHDLGVDAEGEVVVERP